MKEVGDNPHLLTMGDGRLFRPQLSFLTYDQRLSATVLPEAPERSSVP